MDEYKDYVALIEVIYGEQDISYMRYKELRIERVNSYQEALEVTLEDYEECDIESIKIELLDGPLLVNEDIFDMIRKNSYERELLDE